MAGSVAMSVVHEWQFADIWPGKVTPMNELEYLPWGTRSIKLLVVIDDVDEDLYIRPELVMQNGRIAGYLGSPEQPELEISWGGGSELGFEIKRSTKRQHVFFSVTHLDSQLKDKYRLAILVVTKSGVVTGKQVIILRRPANLPDNLLQPMWESNASGVHTLSLKPYRAEGSVSVPFYVSRWWPTAQVRYARISDAIAIPKVVIKCQRRLSPATSRSKAEVFVGEDSAFVTVNGDLEFPLVDRHQVRCDLFTFADGWALRIWFLWLDKTFPVEYTQSLADEEKSALVRWGAAQEVPDAERIDLIFGVQGNLRYVCTDMHWREMWGQPAVKPGSNPFEVVIGGESGMDTLGRGIRILTLSSHTFIPGSGFAGDPSRLVLHQMLNILETGAKGGGTFMHKHTPSLDAVFDIGLTSSDVLAVD